MILYLHSITQAVLQTPTRHVIENTCSHEERHAEVDVLVCL